MKKVISVVLIMVLLFAMTACNEKTEVSEPTSAQETSEAATETASEETEEVKDVKIGLIQFVQHPSLDEVRQGIVDQLLELGYTEDQIDYQNASADMSIINSICQKFVSDGVDVIIAIATPAAQGAVAATEGTDIPVVFSAVTDPVGAGLVETNEVPNTNVTGSSGYVPVEKTIDLAFEMTPDIKSFGFVYCTSEDASLSMIKIASEYLDSLGIEYKEATITNSSELQQATQSIIGDVDALFIPNDNIVATAMPILSEIAITNQKPVYATADSLVNDGGLATIGANYYIVGQTAGEMTDRILNGEEAATMSVQFMEEHIVTVNEETAAAIGVDVSAYVE